MRDGIVLLQAAEKKLAAAEKALREEEAKIEPLRHKRKHLQKILDGSLMVVQSCYVVVFFLNSTHVSCYICQERSEQLRPKADLVRKAKKSSEHIEKIQEDLVEVEREEIEIETVAEKSLRKSQ